EGAGGGEGERGPLQSTADGIIEGLSRPVQFDGELCHFGASVGSDIGMACASGPEIDPARLLANADIALYSAKGSGRGRAEYFTEELRKAAESSRILGNEIRKALEDGQFVAVYQPQVDAVTGELLGAEALARWRHPVRGLVNPGEFLPVAERLGVAPQLDQLILSQALTDLARWDAMGLHAPHLSVNVSAKRLADRNFHAFLAEGDFPKRRLSFEILETVFFDRMDDVTRHAIDIMQESGVLLEVDDFGTGHASLSSLLDLAPNRLKIARPFVTEIDQSDRHKQLVRSMIAVAQALGVDVIAEGVETRAQADTLIELGCVAMQGFYFGKPMTADAFTEDLRRRRDRRGRASA
ncbi:MAG: GGDEF domain-containing phosphodiesterase, partial [Pseudomonadota bacterium]